MVLNRTIVNGNGKKITISSDFAISLLLMIFITLSGWGLVKIVQIPEVYARKETVTKAIECLENKITNTEKRREEATERTKTEILNRLDRLERIFLEGKINVK